MTIQELLQSAEIVSHTAALDRDVAGIFHDTRKLIEGGLFFAIKGAQFDGHTHAKSAIEEGAAAVVAEHPLDGLPTIVVPDTRVALALAAAAFYGYPAEKLKVIGVTGTNGKTTVTHIVRDTLITLTGEKIGLIGTNHNIIGDTVKETARTTPDALALQALLSEMVEAGCTHVVMEVSSHALRLHRVYGIPFTVAAFTNLTQDHLDFHTDMEDYFSAKETLFHMAKIGVTNFDDPYGERLLTEGAEVISYSIEKDAATIVAKNLHLKTASVSFEALAESELYRVKLHVPGRFSAYNALCALGILRALGYNLVDSAEALKTAKGVKGRAEVVYTDEDITVLIDYAHTPDGLQNILATINESKIGRSVILFGCGGDRDKTKRPQMGGIASTLADHCIITSDNPRTEDPHAIIEDILSGIDNPQAVEVIQDRKEAIRRAIAEAQHGDTIILAGKGHELYQEINGIKHPFDEAAEVQKAAALRK